MLTNKQKEHFLERGYVVVHGCFCREIARQRTDRAFEQIGYDRNDSGTWKKSRVTTLGTIRQELQEFSPKAWTATGNVVGGTERIQTPYTWGDAFIFNFRDGAERPWEEPRVARTNWHVDGNWFRHFLDSPEQGLLTFSIWSDIEHQGGGTFIAPDSIAKVARFLADHPEGVLLHEIPFKEIISECEEFVEVTGQIGDVVLCHPFILHANSQNHSGTPRIINNPTVSLKEPLNLTRADSAEYSLVEQSILRALGVARLDWRPTAPREHYTSEQIAEQRQAFNQRHAQTQTQISV